MEAAHEFAGLLQDGAIKENIDTPVSYTHLDVYKRQLMSFYVNYCIFFCIFLQFEWNSGMYFIYLLVLDCQNCGQK